MNQNENQNAFLSTKGAGKYNIRWSVQRGRQKATTLQNPAAYLENIMRFLIQAPNPGRSFPDIVPSLIL